jgi:hypothetical protein
VQFRLDRSALSGNWVETPEGFLRIRATFSRSGCQSYTNPDGSTRVEYRPPEEVSRPDSLLSMGGLPVTLEHPPQLLTPDNAAAYSRGHSGTQVEYHDGFVHGIVTLTGRDAIEAVKRGDAVELSNGYRCDYDPTPGIAPDGTRYDGVQRNISGNHHAVTRRARAGPEVRLHFDSADADGPPIVAVSADLIPSFEVPSMANSQTTRNDKDGPRSRQAMRSASEEMEKEEREGMDDESMEGDDESMEMEEANPVPPRRRARTDSAAAPGKSVPWMVYKAALDDLAAAEQRLDSLEEQLTELEQLVAERMDSAPEPDPELVEQLVAERVEILDKAAEIIGNRERHDGLSNREVMVLALQAANVPIDSIDTRSDEYIAARFDAAHEAADKVPYAHGAAAMLARQLQNIAPAPRADSGADDIAAAAAEHQAALASGWKDSAS